jgi:hypothetical protein
VKGVPVVLDGEIVGRRAAAMFAKRLRKEKVAGRKDRCAEVVHFSGSGSFETVFVFTTSGRMVRPVLNLEEGEEYVETTEQVFLQFESLSSAAVDSPTHRRALQTRSALLRR